MKRSEVDQPGSDTQSNWSGTITYSPATSALPTTLAELVALVKGAVGKVRPRGSGHSWNPAIATSDVSINTSALTGSVSHQEVTDDQGQVSLRVSVPASMNQGHFSLLVQTLGAPLPTQGPAPDITLSGFVANGCHGTGWDQPTIAELVYGIELVGPGGELLRFDEETVPDALSGLGLSAPELMQIVRVNLGSLGVLSRITFQIPKDPFHIKVQQLFPVMTEVFDRSDPSKLQALIEAYDYVEIFWFPYNKFSFKGIIPVPAGPEQDTLWVIAYQRTADPVSPRADWVNAWTDAIGELAVAGVAIGALVGGPAGTGLGSLYVPALSGFAVAQTRVKYRYSDGVVLQPRDAFLYQKVYFPNFVDLELTIPMEGDQGFADVTAAFYQLVDRMEAWRAQGGLTRRYPVNLNVHARFIRNSQATLSPAYAAPGAATHTCYIEYLSYSNGNLIKEYLDFNKDFYSAQNGYGWKAYGGIPNWGKYVQSVPGVFSYLHDRLDAPPEGGGPSRLARFLAVRDQIDPGGATFSNLYLDAIFTGVDPPSLTEALEGVAQPSGPQPTFKPLPDAPVARSFPLGVERLESRLSGESPGGGQVALYHDLASGVAWLLNEHREVNVLVLSLDPGARTVRYQVATASQYLEAEEVLDRIAALHG